MKQSIAIFLLSVFSFAVMAKPGRTNIIPAPVLLQEQTGDFLWDTNTRVVLATNNKDLEQTVAFFTNRINTAMGSNTAILHTKPQTGKQIYIGLNKTINPTIGNEGYQLTVKPTGIGLSANTPAGIFYGLQTLLQLLPAEVENNQFYSKSLHIPCVTITDYPRFGWRGLMLDVSRHFFTKDEVKQYIDEMAKYKFNIFHWHLSDDNGWRIEIKSLPQLTRVGAYRAPRTGRWGSFEKPQPGEKATEGGFYTQADILEIVQYAQAHFIAILPEIDVPAHSLAMIAAYPNLSCTQLPYPVNPGSDFYKSEDNVLCVGNDSVFAVLEKVFTEVAQLFPYQYIHIGGDEAYKGFWKTCSKCQKRMADEHLNSVEELQSYFVKRMEKMLLSKHKKLVGWDEILEGGLAPEATVMSWRGVQGGIEAAKMNHQVIMSPVSSCYLDFYQGEPTAEPPTYAMCRLSDSYHFEPVPDGVDARYIMGGQGNLWSESVANLRHAEYMTWPRAMALAEVYWSSRTSHNWDNFIGRVENHFNRLDAAGTKYARSVYNAIITPQKANNTDSLQVQLSTEIKGLDIYYTFDQTNPDHFYPKYNGTPLIFPAGATELHVITYRDGKPVGVQINITKETLMKRIKR